MPIPALLATAAVHHYLIRKGLRMGCGLIVESAEPREVHHFALLIGYGAEAINPYLALKTVEHMERTGQLDGNKDGHAASNYVRAVGKGLLRVMSKMGISTLQSYQGAQIFEAVGISRRVRDAYFCGTPSRVGGIGLDIIAKEVAMRHSRAFPRKRIAGMLLMDPGGIYQGRRGGERHLLSPTSIARIAGRYSFKAPIFVRGLCRRGQRARPAIYPSFPLNILIYAA